jgi:hypothetical protein
VNFLFGGGERRAVAAADDVFLAHNSRETDESLGDEFGVFHEGGGVRNDAGHEEFAVLEFHVFPDLPLVFVPGVPRFEQIGARLHLEHDVDEVHLAHPRADVDSVAGMEADALLGESPQSVVEGLHAERGPLAAVLHTEVGTGDVVGEAAGVINLGG